MSRHLLRSAVGLIALIFLFVACKDAAGPATTPELGDPPVLTGEAALFGDFTISKLSSDGKAAFGSLDGIEITGGSIADITIELVEAPAVGDMQGLVAYDLQPDGLTFSAEVPFRVSLAGVDLGATNPDSLRIGVADGEGGVHDVPSSFNAEENFLEARLTHFSTAVVFESSNAFVGGCGPVVADGVELVKTLITTSVKTAKDFPNNLYVNDRPSINALGIARGVLCARFLDDAGNPLAIVPATIQGINDQGYYLYTTGWEKLVTIEGAPLGKSHLQLILDTKWVNEAKFTKLSANETLPTRATEIGCNTFASCPNAGDIVQTAAEKVGTNNDGHPIHNPPASAVPIDVSADAEIAIPGPLLLGHYFHTPEDFVQPHHVEAGKFLVAASGDSIFRNAVKIVGLDGDAPHVAESYTVMLGEGPFEGDICGFIRGADTVYAAGVGRLGAHLFALDPATGKQLHANSTFVPHPEFAPENLEKPLNPEMYPWPCRGVFVGKGGKKWVYALQFKGAGSLKTTQPHQLYAFDVTTFSITQDGDVTYPIDSAGYGSMMIRGIAVDKGNQALFLGEMQPSMDNETAAVKSNKVIVVKLDAQGGVTGVPEIVLPATPRYSDETCGGQLPYPAGMAMVPYNDKELLLFGHNTGVQVWEVKAETTTETVKVTKMVTPKEGEWIVKGSTPFPSNDMINDYEVMLEDLQGDGVITTQEIILLQAQMSTLTDVSDSFIFWSQSAISSAQIPQMMQSFIEQAKAPKAVEVDETVTTQTVGLTELGDLDLKQYGQMFMQFAMTPDGQRWLAMPMCKILKENSDLLLPYGAGTEGSDRNLIPIFATTGDATLPPLAQTTIDFNNDGILDHAVDADYYHLKRWIRSFGSTLAIPPVVYTGPQMAVSQHYVAIRGTGIQGNGAESISSSGMGQVQDIGIFSLETGKGLIFPQETVDGLVFDYNPFINGLSSNAGRGFGIWGLELGPVDAESSTGAILYLPN